MVVVVVVDREDRDVYFRFRVVLDFVTVEYEEAVDVIEVHVERSEVDRVNDADRERDNER